MAEKRESGRIKDSEQKRILDEAARRRRQRKALEALEQDNFQEDPHADLKMSKKAPKFEESIDATSQPSRKKRKYRSDHFKYKFKKSFSALLEEESMLNKDQDQPWYMTQGVPNSRFPPRHFCAVCGYTSSYTCVQCGARYCSVRCLGTHQDTSYLHLEIDLQLDQNHSKSLAQPSIHSFQTLTQAIQKYYTSLKVFKMDSLRILQDLYQL